MSSKYANLIDSSFADRSIDGRHVDPTDAGTVLHFEAHVAVFAPLCAPVIPQDPILSTGLTIRAKTNQNGGMIKLGATLSAVKYAMLVLQEYILIPLHCNGYWLFRNGSFELVNVIWCHIEPINDIDAG